jgi:hypothetical protein
MEYWIIGKNLEILDKKKGGKLYFLNLSALYLPVKLVGFLFRVLCG